MDIHKIGLVLTRKNAVKVTAAGNKVEKARKRGVQSPASTSELCNAISKHQQTQKEVEFFKKSNFLRQWSTVKGALSRYTDDPWNIWDVLVSLSALAVVRGCLFRESWKHHPHGR